MKTLKTLVLAGAGLLLAGAANAQVAAPTVAPVGPTNYSTLTPNNPNTAAPTANSGRNQAAYYETSVVQQLGTGQYASVLQAGSSMGNPLTADIQQEASAANADAYQQQKGNGSTYGAGDHAYIFQSGGARGVASQLQEGDNNNAVVRQTSGDANRGFQHQIGTGNNGEIDQQGGSNFANQVQNGMNNQARTQQQAISNWSTINQQGSANTALVRQQ